MAIKAYLYSRYSSPSQAKGDTLRRQLESAQEFAASHGVELDTQTKDKGVSGYTGANRVKGALGSFIARVAAGEIERGSFLVLDSMDRLTREELNEVMYLVSGLARAGIRIVDQAENRLHAQRALLQKVLGL